MCVVGYTICLPSVHIQRCQQSDVRIAYASSSPQDDSRQTRKDRKSQDKWRKKFARKLRKPRTSSAQSYHSDWHDDDDDDRGDGGGPGGDGRHGGAVSTVRQRAHTIDSADTTRARSAGSAAAKIQRRKRRQSKQASMGDIEERPPTAPGGASTHYVKRDKSLRAARSRSATSTPEVTLSDTARRASPVTPQAEVTASSIPSSAQQAPASTSFASEIRQRAHQQRAKIFERPTDDQETEKVSGAEKRRTLARHMTLAQDATTLDGDKVKREPPTSQPTVKADATSPDDDTDTGHESTAS